MAEQTFQEQVDAFVAQGYELVQRGRIVEPDPSIKRPAFADRADGFRISMLGTYAAPTWRSKYDNRLLDDGHEWAHLRKERS